MITPYKYRYHLGNDLEKEDNKYVIYYKGEKRLIENRNVEFNSDGILTKEDFNKIVEGTKGIEDIRGEFKIIEDKSVSLIIKIVDGKASVYMDNHGFTIHELNGILHDIITDKVLSKIEELPIEKEE
jgi:hypothetical protein